MGVPAVHAVSYRAVRVAGWSQIDLQGCPSEGYVDRLGRSRCGCAPPALSVSAVPVSDYPVIGRVAAAVKNRRGGEKLFSSYRNKTGAG